MCVAYNDYGDLIASAFTYDGLVQKVWCAGYETDEVFIGRVSP